MNESNAAARIRNTTLLFAFCAVSFSFNADESIKTLTVSELREDLLTLRKALEKYHPGLYWYTPKEQFDLTWDSLIEQATKPLTEDQFFKLTLPVVAKVKCAHTFFFPSPSIMKSGRRFPIDIKFISGNAYLMTDSAEEQIIPKGSELLSINGRSMNDIVARLFPALQSQGGNIGWKYVVLENDFQNYYHYLIEQTDQFQIEYINHKTKRKESTTVNGSDEEFLRKHWKNWYPVKDGGPLAIEYSPNTDVAIITVKSFVRGRAKEYGQDFDKLMVQFFGEVRTKGIQKLIIDVRGNEGGNNPEKLYSYIAKERSRNPDVRPNDKNAYITPVGNNFEGQVIVLANERSISAQETFVSIFKNNNRGYIVGRATPGCFKGLCGGKKHKVVLPNSGFEIRIPMHASPRFYADPAKYKEGEGFAPDFNVEENLEDILDGKDTQKEFAIGLIKN
jgi:hypothetical protein